MTEETKKSKKIFKIKEKYLKRGGYIALGIIAFIFLFYLFNFRYGLSNSNNDWGTFGDYFGGVLNPILSFLAFIALLYTIKIQQDALSITHEELELTREELKLSRLEMEKSSDALENQSDSLNLQNFENTFFRLLEIHLDAISNTKTRNNVTGLQCYKHMYTNLESKLSTPKDDKFSYKLVNSYFAVYEMHKDEMSRFFNLHINLIDIINKGKEKKIKDYNPTYYMNIVRRQYDKNQTILLFLFYLSTRNDTYIDILKETLFFSNLEIDLIHGFRTHLEEQYNFKENNFKTKPNLAIDFICDVYKQDDETRKKDMD